MLTNTVSGGSRKDHKAPANERKKACGGFLEVIISDADSGEEFDLASNFQSLETDEETGAVASFSGFVRRSQRLGISGDESGTATVDEQCRVDLTAMRIEHYPGMTERVITEISKQAMKRWSLQACRVVHRVGTLKVGEPIVLVVTASTHRADAFAACEFIMDFLKTDAPFWKKAIYGDGEQWVEQNQLDLERKDRW